MSMITGCPACGTLFRVVPDQLKVSEGWVRCGHCGEVFDASAHLQDAPAQQPLAGAPADASRMPAVPAPAALAQPPAAPATPPPVPTPAPAPLATAAPEPQRVFPADADHDDVPASSFLARPDDEMDSVAWADALPGAGAAGSVSTLEVDSDYVREVEAITSRRGAGPDEDDEDGDNDALARAGVADPLEQVSFVRTAQRKAFWRRPLVRTVLAVAAVLLLALLALQVAVHARDRLAASHPGLRPVLEAVCEPLGCAIGPPRRIESLAIDSSGFVRLRPDTYRLTLTVRNQALQPVAVPHIELTLTDAQDQPVLRRVLTPADLGGGADTIAAAAEWSGALALSVSLPPGVPRVAGYRLLAFYP